MTYTKPAIHKVGDAAKLVQSSLNKVAQPIDSVTGPNNRTGSGAAYEADE